jgi:predicted nuclease of predicted toxin-antitoxin system
MAGPLLFDENLSPRLAGAMGAGFPGSSHVRDVGLKGSNDQEIWTFASMQGFTIVTKDDDFRGLSLLRGAPPKVIWLVVGNTSTADILRILIGNAGAIEAFISEPDTSLLTLRKL